MKRGLYVAVAIVALVITLIASFTATYLLIYKTLGGPSSSGIILIAGLSIIGLLFPILSLLSVKGISPEFVFSKKSHKVYFIINIIIVLVAIILLLNITVFGTRGNEDPANQEVKSQLIRLFNVSSG